MIDRLSKVYTWVLLLPAFLPLLVIDAVVYPMVTPKTLVLRALGIVAFAIFIYLAAAGRAFYVERLKYWGTWVPGTLLVVAYTASMFSLDFYHGFWSTLERGDGLFTLTVIVEYFYLILISADRAFTKRFISIVSWVGIAVAGIAVLQWLQEVGDIDLPLIPEPNGRIGGTLGNAAYLAGYLGVVLFVTLIYLRGLSGSWRTFVRAGVALEVIAILLAATRGTLLALLLVGVFVLLYKAFFDGASAARRPYQRWLVALVLAVALFIGFRGSLSQIPIEPIRRLASISLSDTTVSSRLFLWQNLTTEAFRRPWLGYGSEQIAPLFDKVYDPTKIVEQWFDRSHNSFLDYFLQYGIFGLALYLLLIGAFAWQSLRLARAPDQETTYLGKLLVLLIAVYAVQDFFVFDTAWVLWLVLSLFSLVLAYDDISKPRPLLRAGVFTIPAAVIGVALLLLIYPAIITPLRANILLANGYRLQIIDVPAANALLQKGFALNTYADIDYGYRAYDMYTGPQRQRLTGQAKIDAYEYALAVLTEDFKRYPYDARLATYLGHVIDSAPEEVVIDDAYLTTVLARAIALSPRRAQAWYLLANIPLRKADMFVTLAQKEPHYRQAIQVLEMYADLVPVAVPRYTLATLYLALGDKTTAKKWADEALPLYTEPDVSAAEPAVKYYIATEDWSHAAFFLEDLADEHPDDYDIYYDLAKVSYLAGNPGRSLEIVRDLRVRNPEILPTDQNFLTAITAYEKSL